MRLLNCTPVLSSCRNPRVRVRVRVRARVRVRVKVRVRDGVRGRDPLTITPSKDLEHPRE